jgi:hypothetical protein
MMMNRFLVLTIAVLAVAPALASPQLLVIDGLKPRYTDVFEVRFWVRNVGQERVYLDSFAPNRFVVEKQAEDGATWIVGETWGCANAGAGSPLSLPPGGSVELRLIPSDSFDLRGATTLFVPANGQHVPIVGRYRVSVRYSTDVWGNILQIPKHVDAVVSESFEVRPRGR